MKSPFPGMAPYLEARWSNVHTTLIVAVQEALQPRLPRGLRARAEERVLLETTDGDPACSYRSDVAVVDTGHGPSAAPGVDAGSAHAPTGVVVIDFHQHQEVERWVQIIDTTSGNRVVTAIEILSPDNKAPGRLNAAYLRKVDDYRRAGVNLVEIDLLRQPTRARLPVRTEDLPAHRRTPYVVAMQKAEEPERWYVYPLPLRERLPQVPLPLRSGDPDVVLDLQQLIDRAYVAGGHDDIDYRRPPEPPLPPDESEWARALLAARSSD